METVQGTKYRFPSPIQRECRPWPSGRKEKERKKEKKKKSEIIRTQTTSKHCELDCLLVYMLAFFFFCLFVAVDGGFCGCLSFGGRGSGGVFSFINCYTRKPVHFCEGDVAVILLLFVGCLTSQQHASVSQGRICSDNFTCCHTEIEVAHPTFHLTQSQYEYTDTWPTSPSADPITPGAWQGSHWVAKFEVTGMTRPRDLTPASSALEADTLTTNPMRRYVAGSGVYV